MSLSATRPPCPHCGRPQKPRGLAGHVRHCAARPQPPALPAAPAPAAVVLCPSPARPPLSGPSALVLSLLETRPDDPDVRQSLRRRYLVCRAMDWGILETR